MTNSGDNEVSDKERTAERKGNRTEDSTEKAAETQRGYYREGSRDKERTVQRRQQRQRGSWRKRPFKTALAQKGADRETTNKGEGSKKRALGRDGVAETV